MKTPASSDFLTPVTRTSLTIDISRKLVSHLIRGQWTEGEKIPTERELCEKLGVGRASLREALKALEIMGMVKVRQGQGVYVCKRSEFFSRPLLWAIASSSEASSRELAEARILIEVELAGLAAERATPACIKQLSDALKSMEKLKRDPEGFAQADINFHLAIGQATSNIILMNAQELIRNLLQRWIRVSVARDGVTEKACVQHRSILIAIKNHDRVAARTAMQEHLQDMQEFFRAVSNRQIDDLG